MTINWKEIEKWEKTAELYPPDVIEKRMNALLLAGARRPVTQEQRELLDQMAKEFDARIDYYRKKPKKGKKP